MLFTESVVKTESANDTNDENTFAAVKTEYTYPEYADNKTSNRVESYVNKVYCGTDTDNGYTSYTGYSYDYDANGNITAEYSLNASGTETLRYGYVYDELNQLVRVNDAVAQKTYTYTYDGAGNILAKTTYPYTTGDLGTANGTVNYTYDSTWKDKIVSYGNTSLTYDNVGNPLTIGNKQFTWSGRQLETYTQGTKTIEFEYDENGLRHRKTVKENGVITERYDYVWSEGTLISQTYTTYSNGAVNTSNTAKFIYDNWGTLQGFVLNDTATYLYTKNLQGDITSILNENGQIILNYTYDAWGAVTFSATSMQNMLLAYTLSYVSPFTYRGYSYDYDIELYYLQSRYYSAEIGRFINTDDTQIAIATQGEILGVHLFAYCNNNPVMNVDYNGFSALAAATVSTIGLLLVAVCALVSYYLLCNILYTLLSRVNYSKVLTAISPLWNAPLSRIKQKLLISVALASVIIASLSLVLTIAKADVQIKSKVKNNSKTRYWEAYEGPNGTVILGKSLSFTKAINRLKTKRSVFAVTKYEARTLANRVSNAWHHNRHGSVVGHYNHYHTSSHVHVWYLF